jgi:hypothetical protein
MQGQWFGDRRDIVKWAALIYLAREFQIKHILQVAFLRPAASSDNCLLVNGKPQKDIINKVGQHFWDLHRIQELASQMEVNIEVFDQIFSLPREKYIQAVCDNIAAQAFRPLIVFLDPDTGLAPQSRADLGHVLPSEVGKIYRELRPNDILACYQHAYRDKQWLTKKQREFSDAVGVATKDIKNLTCPTMAKDVAFLAVKK